MQPQWIERLFKPFRLTRADFILILIPALIWPTLVTNRDTTIRTHCTQAGACSPQEIPAMDQPGYYIENPGADLYSFYTQNSSGVVLGAGILLGALIPSARWLGVATELVIGIEATLWNGMTTELVRHFAQRPRPFVYHNPTGEAQWSANYVSFYSGHTSFAMAANLMLFFILLSRRSHPAILWLCFAAGQALVMSTAIYRVLAGRHFISDTIAGMIGASLVVTLLAWLHARGTQPQKL